MTSTFSQVEVPEKPQCPYYTKDIYLCHFLIPQTQPYVICVVDVKLIVMYVRINDMFLKTAHMQDDALTFTALKSSLQVQSSQVTALWDVNSQTNNNSPSGIPTSVGFLFV